jgi:hypothetical protein
VNLLLLTRKGRMVRAYVLCGPHTTETLGDLRTGGPTAWRDPREGYAWHRFNLGLVNSYSCSAEPARAPCCEMCLHGPGPDPGEGRAA